MKATAAAFLALVLALPMAALAGQDEVIITTTQLEPRVLQTTTAQRAIFVNRSGRPVHVEFKGSAAGHNVFQVADRIWAQFHTAGPYLYVVHFSDGRTRELRGVVEVRHVPERGASCPRAAEYRSREFVSFPESAGVQRVTVREVCLER